MGTSTWPQTWIQCSITEWYVPWPPASRSLSGCLQILAFYADHVVAVLVSPFQTTALHSLRSALSLARDASGRPILPPSASAKSNGTNKRKGATTSSSGRAADAASTGAGAGVGTEGAATLGAEATALSARQSGQGVTAPGIDEAEDAEMLDEGL